MRVGGEDGEDGAEGLVGEVVGEPGLDDGQGGAGIEQHGRSPERAEQQRGCTPTGLVSGGGEEGAMHKPCLPVARVHRTRAI